MHINVRTGVYTLSPPCSDKLYFAPPPLPPTHTHTNASNFLNKSLAIGKHAFMVKMKYPSEAINNQITWLLIENGLLFWEQSSTVGEVT